MSYSTQSDSSCHFEIFFFGQTMTCSRSKLFLNILGNHFLHFVNGITSKDQVLFLIVWAHKSVTGHLFCFFVLRSSVKFLVLWFGIRPSSRSGSFLFICSRCISCVFMRQSFRKRMSMQRSKEITKQFIINKKKKKKCGGEGGRWTYLRLWCLVASFRSILLQYHEVAVEYIPSGQSKTFCLFYPITMPYSV